MWLIAVGIVGDASAAEDVMQDAAMVALRKLDQFHRGTSFRSWVGAIVRNVALNAVRSDRRRKSSLGQWTAQNESMMAQDDDSHRTPTAGGLPDARVVAALAEMGDVARACLLLRTVGNLQYAEIATLLEIPEGTAMSHVHRARVHLRQRLAGVWEEQGGGGATA
jgi:RNA polymerase sigma-70 factor (ECF subfamily)